jgi:hypothetical protein
MTWGRHAIRRGHAALLATVVSCAGMLAVLHGQSPAEVRVGYARLALAAQASRTDQLGGEALYVVAVYAEAPRLDLGRLASADVAKAVRVEIASDDDPFSPLTRPWRRELTPDLNPGAATQLRVLTASVRKGDVLLVEFEPGKGTTIRSGRQTIVTRAPHDLMIAFLDHWLGQRPVSEELKRALLERPK